MKATGGLQNGRVQYFCFLGMTNMSDSLNNFSAKIQFFFSFKDVQMVCLSEQAAKQLILLSNSGPQINAQGITPQFLSQQENSAGFSASHTIPDYLLMMLGFHFHVSLIKWVRNEVPPFQFTRVKCVKIPE